jgi:hypothetical protein
VRFQRQAQSEQQGVGDVSSRWLCMSSCGDKGWKLVVCVMMSPAVLVGHACNQEARVIGGSTEMIGAAEIYRTRPSI